MTAPTKLATFAAGLLVVFAAAFGVGRLVATDPDSGPAPSATTTTTVATHAHGGDR